MLIVYEVLARCLSYNLLLMRFVNCVAALLVLSVCVLSADVIQSFAQGPQATALDVVDLRNKFPNTSSAKQYCQAAGAICSKAVKPVCAYSLPIYTRTNFTNDCSACKSSLDVAFFTNGYCRPPRAPRFTKCQFHTDLVTKCELVSLVYKTPYCLIYTNGNARTILEVSTCTNLCAEPNSYQYINARCDMSHEGRTIEEWGRAIVLNLKTPPRLPMKTLPVGYTKCTDRQTVCPRNQNQTVCGIIQSAIQKEFDSPCQACQNLRVKGWSKGTCSEIISPSYIICPATGSAYSQSQ